MGKVRKNQEQPVTIEKLKEKYEDAAELSYSQECELMDALVHKLNYYPVNKELVRKYGWMFAGLLAMYIDMSIYTIQAHPRQKGWFYCTKQALYEKGHMSDTFVMTAKKILIQSGMMQVKVIGMPAKEWYKLNPLKLIELFSKTEKPIEKINERTNKKVRDAFEQDAMGLTEGGNTCYTRIPNPTADRIPNPAAKYKNRLNKNKYPSTNVLCGSDEPHITNVLCGSDEPPNLLSNDPLDIISYWNTLPNVTKHKLDPSSKTIQSACKMLSALLQGIPMVNTKGNQPRKEMRTFFQSYKIDQVYLRKKWSVQEIKNLLLSAVTIKNGQMNTKISLPVLLWNEFASKDSNGNKTAFSWFLYALAVDCTPQAFIDMATSLAKSVNGKNHPILKWANELYRFSLAEEMTPPPMAALLRWYLLNKDQSFMPMVRDMDEFIRKYRQIEDNRSHRRKNGGRSRLHVDEPVEFYDCKGNLIPSEQSGKINVDELEFYDGKGNLIPKDSAR